MDLQARLIPLVDEGLGNSAYLFDLGDGRALAVDPSLDLRAAGIQAARRGLRIAYAAETHLHADFLSGARQLAADHGARILASAAGQREFDHTGLADGDEVDLGGLTLRAWETPGQKMSASVPGLDGHIHPTFPPFDMAIVAHEGDRSAEVFARAAQQVGANVTIHDCVQGACAWLEVDPAVTQRMLDAIRDGFVQTTT